jgi:hypothetical protein
MHENIESQWSQGWYGRTMGAPTPLGAPPGLGFRLGTHAYMGILVMLVSDYDSIVSQHDRAKMQYIKLNQECSNFKFHMIFVIKSGISCGQHVSSKIEQE